LDRYKTYSDEQLVELLKSGDTVAFTELYTRYWKLLFALVASRLHNFYDAEEIVQDVFADIWNRRSKINISTSVQSFLSASVRYQTWRTMARQRKEFQHKQKGLNNEASESLIAEIEMKLLFDQLQERITKLPQKCRVVYQLRKIEGLSNKQVASQLQITEKAVERNMTRAIKQLRTGIEIVILTIFTLF
jgi:RNA polymerase sigma-70 factor (family 1)